MLPKGGDTVYVDHRVVKRLVYWKITQHFNSFSGAQWLHLHYMSNVVNKRLKKGGERYKYQRPRDQNRQSSLVCSPLQILLREVESEGVVIIFKVVLIQQSAEFVQLQ